jgi:hypothetical protein
MKIGKIIRELNVGYRAKHTSRQYSESVTFCFDCKGGKKNEIYNVAILCFICTSTKEIENYKEKFRDRFCD